MKKEIFKADLLEIARNKPEIIRLMAFKNNLGQAERINSYTNECVYRSIKHKLLIRIARRENTIDIPEFDIQFSDGLEMPSNWRQSVIGDFGMSFPVRCIAYEKMEIEPNAIVFYLNRVWIIANEKGCVLETKEEKVHVTSCCLDKGHLYFTNPRGLTFIHQAGRTKGSARTDFFVDCPVGNDILQELSDRMTEWGTYNGFTAVEMQKIDEFILFCKRFKGNKRKSKMVQIMEYLKLFQFPYRYE